MSLLWNEIRARALAFSLEWTDAKPFFFTFYRLAINS